jgi:hypothetical protein
LGGRHKKHCITIRQERHKKESFAIRVVEIWNRLPDRAKLTEKLEFQEGAQKNYYGLDSKRTDGGK